MEYSIRELSRLSGVSTRTLRWYDEIGLLKPGRVAESGYRYYGPAQVDRLQDILYYRALGVELARIKECLDMPSFDRLAALREHLAALQAQKTRLETLIRSVEETIGCEERKETMEDEKKFAAFKEKLVADNEAAHGKGETVVLRREDKFRIVVLLESRAVRLEIVLLGFRHGGTILQCRLAQGAAVVDGIHLVDGDEVDRRGIPVLAGEVMPRRGGRCEQQKHDQKSDCFHRL